MSDESSEHSVSRWLGPLQDGDDEAAQELWNRYYQQLVTLARRHLQNTPRREADEEDVALEAFHNFCDGAVTGRFPQLNDRQDLWKLLVVITARQASTLKRRQRRQKRGGGNVRGESALIDPKGEADFGIHDVMDQQPSPEFAAQLVELRERLLDRLDTSLRQIALWKMEGLSNAWVAEKLRCTPRNIQRKLEYIREVWRRACS